MDSRLFEKLLSRSRNLRGGRVGLWGRVNLWEVQVRRATIRFLASERVTVLGKAVHKTAMAQKELSILDTHESIETVCTACWNQKPEKIVVLSTGLAVTKKRCFSPVFHLVLR